MRTLTLYFVPGTNTRLARIKAHLSWLSLSQIIAHVLMAAERELAEYPNARPWEEDLPSTEPASRHTVYLHARTEERLETLRHEFQRMGGQPGLAVLRSVVVARAIALAERRILALSGEDLELLRIRSDAAAIDVEVSHLAEQSGEETIAQLVDCLRQTTTLYTRAQRTQNSAARSWKSPRPRFVPNAWREASEFMTGPLNDVMRNITNAITQVRRATDARAVGS
jgi:hypothetical protein